MSLLKIVVNIGSGKKACKPLYYEIEIFLSIDLIL